MNIENNADKAAILILSMGETAASKILAKLDKEQLSKVSQRMANIKGLTVGQAANVIESFFGDFREHSGISSASRDYLEKSLDMAIGKRLAQTMIDDIYGDELKDEFQKLQWIPPETLARFFSGEHLQMQAVLLSFMPPECASEVLFHLPEDTHRELMYKVATMSEVNEQILEELRVTLENCFEYVSHQKTSRVNGVKQAAEILNRFGGNSSEIMESFKEQNEPLAASVRENMYDFVTLGRQSADVLQSLVQELDEGSLSLALKGADEEVYGAIMGALPKRMADAIKDRMDLMGAVPVSKVEAARKEVMTTVREMHEAEEIEYQIFEEKVVD